MSDKAWTGKTGGTRWMQQFLISTFRYLPACLMYPLMYLWIIGYIIGVPSARKGIYYYWRHRKGYTALQSVWHLWLTYVAFGKAILDRFAAWAGHKVETQVEDLDKLHDLVNKNQGVLMLSSHIGNQELAGYNFTMFKPMYALMYMGDTEIVNTQRTSLFESMGIYAIPYRQDGSHILDMHNAIVNGNILSIHGDRMLNGVKTLKSPILGEEASFPEGPFHVAVAEKVPVVSLFMMREGKDKYHLFLKVLSEGIYQSSFKKEQEMELLDAYIKSIEDMVNRYPHQWFHFYEFWHKN